MSTETFTKAFGRSVIASDTAESIGSVKGFVVDGHGRTIEAIHLDGHGRRASVLDWSSVTAFGSDAVMASAETAPSRVDTDHQKASVAGDVTMIGTRVLTVDGLAIGVVDDVEFDTASGAVVRVMTDQGPIGADRLRSLGSYALVVDPGA